jgi:hypothetical protein
VGISPGRHAAGRPRSSFVMTNAIAGKSVLPPPPRAPISRFCITRKKYIPAPLFEGAPLRRRTSPLGSPDPRRRGTAWVSALRTVAGRSAPGPAGGFPGPGQPLRRLPRPGQPPRPCEAVQSPVPPFKGRSDRLHLREAAEAALGGRRSGDLSSGHAPKAPPRSSRLAALCSFPNAQVPP